MSKTITSTLTLRFDDDSDDGYDENGNKTKRQSDRDEKQSDDTSKYYLVLEQVSPELVSDDSQVVIESYIKIHCFPPGAEIIPSLGRIVLSAVRVKKCMQVLQFNGSDGVRLQYPNATAVAIEPLGSALKVVYDKEGNGTGTTSVSPSYSFKSGTNSIVVYDGFDLAKIYGACKVTYESSYGEFLYYPDPIPLAELNSRGTKENNYFGGTLFAQSVVGNRLYATTLDVRLEPPPKPVEFARVYSHVVIDADGPHEAPEGWKTDKNTVIDGYMFNSELRKSNPKLDLKEELDPDNAYTYERTHLLITINANGHLFYEYYSHKYQDPFQAKLIQYMDGLAAVAFGNWSVQFWIRFSEPPGGRLPKSAESFYFDMYNLTWRDIFLHVDQAKVLQSLKENHYANLLQEGEEE